MKKKLLALAMVATMALSLTACGNKAGGASGKGKEAYVLESTEEISISNMQVTISTMKEDYGYHDVMVTFDAKNNTDQDLLSESVHMVLLDEKGKEVELTFLEQNSDQYNTDIRYLKAHDEATFGYEFAIKTDTFDYDSVAFRFDNNVFATNEQVIAQDQMKVSADLDLSNQDPQLNFTVTNQSELPITSGYVTVVAKDPDGQIVFVNTTGGIEWTDFPESVEAGASKDFHFDYFSLRGYTIDKLKELHPDVAYTYYVYGVSQ